MYESFSPWWFVGTSYGLAVFLVVGYGWWHSLRMRRLQGFLDQELKGDGS